MLPPPAIAGVPPTPLEPCLSQDTTSHAGPKECFVHLPQGSGREVGRPGCSKGSGEPVKGVEQGLQQKVPEGSLPPGGQCAEHRRAKLKSNGRWGHSRAAWNPYEGSVVQASGQKSCGPFEL